MESEQPAIEPVHFVGRWSAAGPFWELGFFLLSSLCHLGGWRENSTDALVALIVRRLRLAILCLNNDATFFRLDGRERFGRYTTQCATLLSLPSNCAKIKGNKYARYQGSIPNKMWHHKLKLPAKDIKH